MAIPGQSLGSIGRGKVAPVCRPATGMGTTRPRPAYLLGGAGASPF